MALVVAAFRELAAVDVRAAADGDRPDVGRRRAGASRGVELDLFAVFAVVTFVGIGVDYGIHLVHRYHERGDAEHATAELAPVILVGSRDHAGRLRHARFGPPTRRLRSIGIVSAASTVALAAASVLVLPALLLSGHAGGDAGRGRRSDSMTPRTAAVIPAFDESGSIARVVDGPARHRRSRDRGRRWVVGSDGGARARPPAPRSSSTAPTSARDTPSARASRGCSRASSRTCCCSMATCSICPRRPRRWSTRAVRSGRRRGPRPAAIRPRQDAAVALSREQDRQPGAVVVRRRSGRGHAVRLPRVSRRRAQAAAV